MKPIKFACSFLLLTLSFNCANPVNADVVNFTTDSTALQTIDSPVLGGQFNLATPGLQSFSIDPMAGTADTDSFFVGDDLPDPFAMGSFLTYELYNTDTIGTATDTGMGLFDVSFSLLFELEVTSGPLSGLIFETVDPSVFSATDVELPFMNGTTFDSPEPIGLFVQFDPTGTFQPGTPIGTSLNRTVVNNFVVPEPSTGMLLGLCAATLFGRRRR